MAIPSGGSASSFAAASQAASSTLVYYLDIFILSVILLFALLNVPRMLVYMANATRSTEQRSLELKPGLESAVAPKKSWHLPMHLSLRHPATSFIQFRIFEHYNVVQVFLMAGYTAAVFFVAFYGSNPFTDLQRSGWVIASQIPFVYAFAAKNNVIGLLVGVGYEKLNFFHRHVGRLMVIGANVHGIGRIYQWSLAGDIVQNLALPNIRWGIVALVCFDLLGFLSLKYVRAKSYNLFFGTHAVGLIVVLIAVCYHQQACIPYVIAASVVYGLDHIIRAIKTRFVTANLRIIPELALTRIDVPSLNAGWRAGQHVRLRVLSTAMGPWGMTEVHPFTIASATKTEEGLVLMCKRTGNWTRKLYEMAQSTASDELARKPGRRVKMMVEGPYGGIGPTHVPSYSGAMFVVGGSGITFALSMVRDLVVAGNGSRTNVVVEVIWSVPDPAVLEEFLPLFSSLVSRSSPTRLRVSVFYTRSITHSFEELPLGITLAHGRPKIGKLLDAFVKFTIDKGGAHGAFVAVCGPVSLAGDVAHTVRTYDVHSKRAVGGIEFHEEVFGW